MRAGVAWCLRRGLLAPLMPALAVVAAAVWLVTAVLSLLLEPPFCLVRRHSPRWRPLRLATFGLLYFAGETVCLLCCLAVWVASGFGLRLRGARSRRAHRRILAGFLGGVVLASRLLFGFRLTVAEPANHPADVLAAGGDDPVVVLARHAGPGASFALVHLLIARYRRQVRVVLKSQLRLDPAIDVLLTHAGCAWIPWNAPPGTSVRSVHDAAATLGPRDALVLFPEGADWTPVRHLEAVARLRGRGRFRQARAALRMPHVLPPRPGGTIAALRGAPTADVLVFTHTGHDELLDAASTWRALPLREPLRMVWWRVPARQVRGEGEPGADEDAVAEWLQHTWKDIDAWIGEQEDLSLAREDVP